MASMQLGATLPHIHRLFGDGAVGGLNDAQLLERFVARRDGDAFASLVERHGAMVLGTCRAVLKDPHDAEDAFQATFLVLVQKAQSIRGQDALGGWLHRVAYRIALHANAESARQRARERQAGKDALAFDDRSQHADDWRPMLHEEVEQLPSKYRLPVVLCDLEGLTKGEAAARLRWTEGMVRGRLERARALLRKRLTRRGATLAGGVLAAITTRHASAAVPDSWISATVRAALGTTTGSASPVAVALAGRVAASLVVAQAKATATTLLILIALACTSLVVLADGSRRNDARETVAPPAPEASATPAVVNAPAIPKGEGAPLDIAGRVLAPDGRPVAGATIRVFPRAWDMVWSPEHPPRPSTTSGADGRFRIRVADPGLVHVLPHTKWMHPSVAAVADGYGPGWVKFTSADEAGDLTLKLVKDDVPITGRVLDLEGRPIAGVTVKGMRLNAMADLDMDTWLETAAKPKGRLRELRAALRPYLDLEALGAGRPAVTGPDGRFRLTGFGRDRVVMLGFEGPTIVTSSDEFVAMTRPDVSVRLEKERGEPEVVIHGSTFDFVAAPTRPIAGVVRDKATGRPIPGVSVRSELFATSRVHGVDHVRTTTDADGRYRLVGMPRGAGNLIAAIPGGAGQPYFAAEAKVPGGFGPSAVEVDFALTRGIPIRGKVTDKVTGRPIRTNVEYDAFLDNPRAPDIRFTHHQEVTTREDGIYEIVGLPGRGLLAVQGTFGNLYPRGQGVDKIPEKDRLGDPNFPFNTISRSFDVHSYVAFVEVKAAEDADSATCDVVLDPGRQVRGQVLGPDGHPLPGTNVAGLHPVEIDAKLPTAEFVAVGLETGHPRPLFFRHEEKHLAATLVLRGDESGPQDVRLGPASSVVGRLLDQDGQPRAGYTVHINIDPKQFGQPQLFPQYLRPTIDDQGRFRIENMVPGVAYNLNVLDGDIIDGKLVGKIAQGLTLQPGEARDLGEVRVHPDRPKSGP